MTCLGSLCGMFSIINWKFQNWPEHSHFSCANFDVDFFSRTSFFSSTSSIFFSSGDFHNHLVWVGEMAYRVKYQLCKGPETEGSLDLDGQIVKAANTRCRESDCRRWLPMHLYRQGNLHICKHTCTQRPSVLYGWWLWDLLWVSFFCLLRPMFLCYFPSLTLTHFKRGLLILWVLLMFLSFLAQ